MGQELCSGVCGEDMFAKLSSQYGQDFTKFMLAEKAKQVVNQEFGKLTTQSNNIFGDFQNKSSNIVDEKQKELNNIFEDAKSKVGSVVPGGIPALERIKGSSINEFSGYNGLTSQINGIKTQTNEKIQTELKTLQNTMNADKQNAIDTLNKNRPAIPIYDQLPEPVRATVFSEAEKHFSQQMGKDENSIIGAISSKFNPNSMQGMFGMLSPENALSGIVGKAAGVITQALGLGNLGGLAGGLIGGGGLGGLGGLAGGLMGGQQGGFGNPIGGLFGK